MSYLGRHKAWPCHGFMDSGLPDWRRRACQRDTRHKLGRLYALRWGGAVRGASDVSCTELDSSHLKRAHPSMRNRSLTSHRCGDVKRAVRYPAVRRMPSTMAQVEPCILTQECIISGTNPLFEFPVWLRFDNVLSTAHGLIRVPAPGLKSQKYDSRLRHL